MNREELKAKLLKMKALAERRELGEIPNTVCPLRRLECEMSLLQFGLTYCFGKDKMMKRKPSPGMVRFVNALQETIEHGGNWRPLATRQGQKTGDSLTFAICITSGTGRTSSASLHDPFRRASGT